MITYYPSHGIRKHPDSRSAGGLARRKPTLLLRFSGSLRLRFAVINPKPCFRHGPGVRDRDALIREPGDEPKHQHHHRQADTRDKGLACAAPPAGGEKSGQLSFHGFAQTIDDLHGVPTAATGPAPPGLGTRG